MNNQAYDQFLSSTMKALDKSKVSTKSSVKKVKTSGEPSNIFPGEDSQTTRLGQYLNATKEDGLKRELASAETNLHGTIQGLAEAHVARELDEIKIKMLTAKVTELTENLKSKEDIDKLLKETEDELKYTRIENDSLRNEVSSLKESNMRLTEMLSLSQEFKRVSKMAQSSSNNKSKETNSGNSGEPIRHLKGSGAMGKKDFQTLQNTPNSSELKKHHWTYRFWNDLSARGMIEEEDMVWTPERAVDLIKEFLKGNFSSNTDLAIEKLLFEVS